MPFLPPSAAGECTRGVRREGCCRAAAGVCKRGYRTPYPGFLYPLLRLPLTLRSAAQRSFAAKKRGPQLKPLYHRRLFNAVWGWLRPRFPRITVRGSGLWSDRTSDLSGLLPALQESPSYHTNSRYQTGRALSCAANHAIAEPRQTEKGEHRGKICALLVFRRECFAERPAEDQGESQEGV